MPSSLPNTEEVDVHTEPVDLTNIAKMEYTDVKNDVIKCNLIHYHLLTYVLRIL